jgi:hypothetical protein
MSAGGKSFMSHGARRLVLPSIAIPACWQSLSLGAQKALCNFAGGFFGQKQAQSNIGNQKK